MEKIFESILCNSLSLGVISYDTDYKITKTNDWFRKHSGLREDGILGKNIFDLFPEIKKRGKSRYLHDCLDRKQSFILSPMIHEYLIDLKLVKKDVHIQMIQEIKLFPMLCNTTLLGGSIIIKDLTEQVLNERELFYKNRMLDAIRKVNGLMLRVDSEERLFSEAARIISKVLNIPLVWFTKFPDDSEHDDGRKPYIAAFEGAESDYFKKIVKGGADFLSGFSLTQKVVKSGQVQIFNQWKGEKPGFKKQGNFFDTLQPGSIIALPLKYEKQVTGVLHINKGGGKSINLSDLELFNELAGDISFALAAIRNNARRIEAEKDRENYIVQLENQRTELQRIEEELKQHREQLEELVEKRTSELEDSNIQLMEANQMKSRFLSSMSHELRTPLNSIIGYTGILLQEIPGELNDEQKRELKMVSESGHDLLGLISGILDLSKIEAGKIEILPTRFDIKKLMQMVKKMVSPMIDKKGLTIHVLIGEEVPKKVYNDENRIKQVLINLLSNATKFTESGEIRLEVKATQFEIIFSVMDTGIGIMPEHLSDIFDEFKQIEGPLKIKPGGTGLGLSISKKMVELMGGSFRVESEYKKGSCFQFTIPIKKIPVQKKLPVTLPLTIDLSKKLILTIDDEVNSQGILKVYLKYENYEVIQAYNGVEAMELAKKHKPFAITLDILMPGKDGWDILHELKEDPDTQEIPVICISILNNRAMGLALGAFEYLTKPIDKDQFIKELKRLEKQFRIYDILIVDDEPRDVDLMAKYLDESNNYKISKAYGGEQGLLRVRENRPDLILLDLMMPDIDGFEVIRRLKDSNETKTIPIIIVSAKKMTQEEVAFLNKNIENIIKKGNFTREELLDDIKRALEQIGV